MGLGDYALNLNRPHHCPAAPTPHTCIKHSNVSPVHSQPAKSREGRDEEVQSPV